MQGDSFHSIAIPLAFITTREIAPNTWEGELYMLVSKPKPGLPKTPSSSPQVFSTTYKKNQ
jgi:hypothetical protein